MLYGSLYPFKPIRELEINFEVMYNRAELLKYDIDDLLNEEEMHFNKQSESTNCIGVSDRYKFAAKTHMLACGMKAAFL